jgi:xanthine dehydrogenase YagT iron-sulfur-binding subunit
VKPEIRSMREHDPHKPGVANGHSRRDFLRGSSVAAATAVLTGQATLPLPEAEAAEDEPKLLAGTVDITLKVNGQDRSCSVEPRSTLLDTLRHRLDVTGPKRVCDRASCGACTAIIDGDPVYSCTMLAVSCQGKTIETLESFDTGEHGVPHAFHQNDGLMCGYCTPGFVTSCKSLLDKNPNPTLDEVKKGLEGNICRCGTYVGVMQAALAAAKAMKGA